MTFVKILLFVHISSNLCLLAKFFLKATEALFLKIIYLSRLENIQKHRWNTTWWTLTMLRAINKCIFYSRQLQISTTTTFWHWVVKKKTLRRTWHWFGIQKILQIQKYIKSVFFLNFKSSMFFVNLWRSINCVNLFKQIQKASVWCQISKWKQNEQKLKTDTRRERWAGGMFQWMLS